MRASGCAARLMMAGVLFFVMSLDALAGVSVVGSLDRLHVADPGEVIRGEIEIQNTLDEDALVRVDVYDQVMDGQANAQYLPPGAHTRSLADYIQLMPAEQTIGPRARARVGFEVKLPTLAERPELAGAYWAVLMIRHEALETFEDLVEKDQWVIQQRFQTAVRITTAVRGQASTALLFQSPVLKLALDPEQAPDPIFLFEAHNKGERLLDVALVGELFSAQGESLGRTQLGQFRIYPGSHRRIEWALADAKGQSLGNRFGNRAEALVMATPASWMPHANRFGARFDLNWGPDVAHQQ